MRVFLAPGASGGPAPIRPYTDGLTARGHVTEPVTLPNGRAERAVNRFLEQSGTGADVVVGGRSFGGRVASLAAADPAHGFGGLLLFAYPLHPPGRPEQLRTEHWPLIRCPVLIIQGEQDPFGSPEEVRREATRLKDVELLFLPGTGHGLKERLGDALDAAAGWLNRLPR